MDQHRLSRRLDWAVAAGVALLHVIGVATWFRGSNAWLALALRDSVPIVWLVLIPTWAVLGTGRAWQRWPAALVALAVWSAIYSGEFFGGGLPFVPPILFSVVFTALASSVVVRMSGLKLHGASPECCREARASRRRESSLPNARSSSPSTTRDRRRLQETPARPSRCVGSCACPRRGW